MNDTVTRKPNGAYPCPNPVTGGCGCPRASSRCYGDLRAMREDFQALRSYGYSREASARVAAAKVGSRWSAEEILRRF